MHRVANSTTVYIVRRFESYSIRQTYGAVAQLGEHLLCKQKVVGSIPTSSTKSLKGLVVAGWSSPVARQAHNLKVMGSNPIPATNL